MSQRSPPTEPGGGATDLGGERSSAALREIAEESIGSPAFTCVVEIASQAALLACVWLACRLLRKPASERLGLVATGLPLAKGAVVLFAVLPGFTEEIFYRGFLQRGLLLR